MTIFWQVFQCMPRGEDVDVGGLHTTEQEAQRYIAYLQDPKTVGFWAPGLTPMYGMRQVRKET
jgi:hypothetical protein